MYVVDASVHISALNPVEAEHPSSRRFLEQIRQRGLTVFEPDILLPEVAAAVARAFDDSVQGLALAAALRQVPDFLFIPVDAPLADAAAEIAATYRLRGCDAVYVAVADRHGAALVTLDRQQLKRAAPAVATLRPADALAQMA